ncbi:metal ABC transporter substrate-binding protein [Synechocystis sp. LKSZ1]|uniref:metal ABC transporter substrate-binding protein n=1 Tax=Synechocystis sp. LKSZ1 TaxID=3144951 RepID=UPI00336C25B3
MQRFGVNLGISLLFFLGLTGCQGESSRPPSSQNAGQPVVLTTFTVIADMAQNVAGDRLQVESITKPGAEVHGYQPTPSDLERGQEAKLILDNGFNLERWAQRFYQNLPQVAHVTLSEGITPIPIQSDAYQGKPNPHAWMSPANALIYVDNIRQALVKLDPANTEIYNRNAQAYRQRIQALDQKLKTVIATLPKNQRYLVTCEGAFAYLAKDYGLENIYIWPTNAEQQATPQQVSRVIETVKDKKIPAVFCESTVSDKAQRQVAQESGAKFAGVFYVDSLSPPEGPAPTYLQLLEHNLNTLINGLSNPS